MAAALAGDAPAQPLECPDYFAGGLRVFVWVILGPSAVSSALLVLNQHGAVMVACLLAASLQQKPWPSLPGTDLEPAGGP